MYYQKNCPPKPILTFVNLIFVISDRCLENSSLEMLSQPRNKKKKHCCLPQKEKKKYTMYLFVLYNYYILKKLSKTFFSSYFSYIIMHLFAIDRLHTKASYCPYLFLKDVFYHFHFY